MPRIPLHFIQTTVLIVTYAEITEAGHQTYLMATESTEEHEKKYFKVFIFPCFSVDSVAIRFLSLLMQPV